eukprot:Tamp_21672.p2 GENE.Tamp_21672~~Tamp_21672.p2  ORF type:complete len:267 (-),score=38.58 Tamp_21672:45-845(-)
MARSITFRAPKKVLTRAPVLTSRTLARERGGRRRERSRARTTSSTPLNVPLCSLTTDRRVLLLQIEAIGALAAATEYKGVTYTEAELNKMPKAEAEYRRELMARSKQEIKMEMGFEQGLKAGLDVYKSVMQKFGADKSDDTPSTTDWESLLPAKGVLQCRFKAKEIQRTGKTDAAVALERAASLKRARGSVAAEEEKKESLSFTDRINRVMSVKFIVIKAVEIGISIGTVALSIVAWAWDTVRGLIGSSPKAEAVRAARAAALSSS